MNKILIVEDDKNILNILSFNLERENYKVLSCEDGLIAIDIVRKNSDISLVLMDAMLPKMNGFESTQEIRKFSNVPILMLTALEGETNVLHGFDSGANDYIIKPFSVKEVLARVKSHIKNKSNLCEHSSSCGSSMNINNDILKINNILLYPSLNLVKIGDKESELTDTELKLLMYFYKNPNKVLSREEIAKEVWGTEYFELRSVDVSIRRLRTKIELNDACPENLKTRRGLGYYLKSNT